MKLKLFLLTALSVAGLILPSNTLASGSLTVRLGQPKSPTNQDNLKLTFVALDYNNGDITVSCYKKSSTDVDFVKFDVDKNLIPGGNTDSCAVNGSILSTAGTYLFKVIAKTSSETKESATVSVDYNTSGPSTPGSYSKERLNDCDYKIKFKTADDSKTVKVELYRSDTNSISLDSGGRVATLNIGPNTDGQFTNSVPTCGKDYYYVIRAVDNYGNVSGTAGDSSTTTTASTTTSTGSTTQPAIAIGTGSQVVEETTGNTTAEATLTPTNTAEPSLSASATAEVLGAQTSKWSNLKWLSIPLVLLAVFFLLKSRKRA